MNESVPIDPAALERLRNLGGPNFLHMMIGLFLELAHKQLEVARAAERAGDARMVGKAVHPLRSSSGNVGAAAMLDLATRIELLAQEQKMDPLPPLLRELEAAFDRVRPHLEKEREALRP
jgi:HPt (histidine-containing phosphotransfer) domain-containing protein